MDSINELAAALAKAQGEILTVSKDAKNPYFKSTYATLAAVREATREAFAKNGLSVVQVPTVFDGMLRLRTILLHASGQSLDCGELAAVVDVDNPQKAGSAITYFRRYALASVAGVVAEDEDDDGNAASQPSPKKRSAKPHITPIPVSGHDVVELQKQIQEAETTDALAAVLKGNIYMALKSDGPSDVYEQTSKLARVRHALLRTPPAEKPF